MDITVFHTLPAKPAVMASATAQTSDCTSATVACTCREAGVRNLKKQLEKIFRKSARTLVERGVGGPPPAPPITPAQSASAVQPSLVEVSPASGSSSEELPSSAPESPHTPGRAGGKAELSMLSSFLVCWQEQDCCAATSTCCLLAG